MKVTWVKLISMTCFSALLGLTACSSKNSVFSLEKKDERWFCTPENDEEWLCQESDNRFEQLAEEHKRRREKNAELEAELENEPTSSEMTAGLDSTQGLVADNVNAQDSGKTGVQESLTDSQAETDTDHSTAKEQTSPETVLTNEDTSNSKRTQNPPTSLGAQMSPWVIQLGAYSKRNSAESLQQKVESSQLFTTRVKGRDYFTVVILGLESRQDAQARALEVKQSHPKLSPWIRQGADFEKYLIP